MNKISQKDGFSLLELIIVLMMISIILAVSLPRFNPTDRSHSSREELNILTRLISSVKQKASQENKTYTLHISPSGSRLWLTNSSMDDSEMQAAMDTPLQTFNTIRISRIERPIITEEDTPTIRFYGKGYSDLVILQIDGLEDSIFLKIEPFLSLLEPVSETIHFDACI